MSIKNCKFNVFFDRNPYISQKVPQKRWPTGFCPHLAHEENNGYSPERAELIRLFPSGRSLPQEPVNGLGGDLMPSDGQVAVIEK